VGTVAYMSPEQARGEAVDNRTDVWSLGVVLYEMVTGRLPFRGEYEQSIVYGILNEIPEPITALRSDVPMELERIVSKALEKEPKRRYQRVGDLLVDLRNLLPSRPISTGVSATRHRQKFRGILIPALILLVVALGIAVGLRVQIGRQPAAVAEENSLAIMYFDNLAEPGDPEKLGEIVTNLLITGLSESQYVQVVSSQRLYDILTVLGREGEKVMNREVASQVAKRANSKWMLTGSILQEKPEIVLTSQLVEVGNGKVIASHRITSTEGENIFSVVDRLAASVKGDLSLPVAAKKETSPPIADLTTHSQEAYRYFLEGWDLARKFYFPEASAAFLKAVEIDSTFAMGYYLLSLVGNVAERPEMIAKAVKYSGHATQLERFYIRAQQAELAGDFPREVKELRKLLERYPKERFAFWLLGNMYNYLGQYDEAVRCYNKVLEMAPLSKETYNILAYMYNAAGDFEKSIGAINKYISLVPEEANPYDTRGDLYAWNGHLNEAIESYNKALEIKPDYYVSLQKLAGMYIFKREYGKAQSCCERLCASSDKDARSWGRSILGALLTNQGKLQQALQVLDDGLAADRIEKVESSPAAYKHSLRAAIFLEKKKLDLAIREAKENCEILRKNRSDFPVDGRDFFVYVLATSGKISQAEGVAGALKGDIDQGDRVSTQHYWQALGAIELAKGNVASAAAQLGKGLEGASAGENPWRVLLAEAYIESDRRGEAVGVLERVNSSYVLTTDPVLVVKAHYLLGVAYEKSGWREKAIEQYQEFLEIWKDADPGIPEVSDARARLQQLRSSS